MCGAASMAHDPHTTTLATATDTSACVAAIAGASADTAVTPHMEVPAANSEPSLGCSPANFAIFGMKYSPAPTEIKTGTRANVPDSRRSDALSLAPTHTMPMRTTVPLAVRNPGRTHLGSVTALFIPAPSKIARGTPATGVPTAVLM